MLSMQPTPPDHTPVDLAGLLEDSRIAQRNYECPLCNDVALLPYPKLRLENPYAGDGYICPKCGTITDSSYTGMRIQVRTGEPVDVGMSSDSYIETIDEQKAFSFSANNTVKDPEPDEDERIKAQGGTIINKRITLAGVDY